MALHTLYTVRRVRKDDELYGPNHASDDAETTACGLRTDHNWWITSNCFDGDITCRKCLDLIRARKHPAEGVVVEE